MGAGEEQGRPGGWLRSASGRLSCRHLIYVVLCSEASLQGGPGGAGPLVGPQNLLLFKPPAPHVPVTQVCPSRSPKPGFCTPAPWCGTETVASRVPSARPSGLRLRQQIQSAHSPSEALERTVFHPGPLLVQGTLEVCPQSPLKSLRAALVCTHGPGSQGRRVCQGNKSAPRESPKLWP